jgi:50S ribosomal protein L16 3-hydroxylase
MRQKNTPRPRPLATASLPRIDDQPPAIDAPSTLLGGLTPQEFMQRHWQKQPLLVRQALPQVVPPVSRAELFQLAARGEVESRLVVRTGKGRTARWTLGHGPLPRRSLPPLATPGWTVLVQGLNQHVPAADELLGRFRFIPQARLDDLMVSWASEGGGVGPHFDSYDVFLIQVQGQRRWRIGRMNDARLRSGVPLKLIANFRAEEEFLLSPGDMLYLPPRWAHDGDAVGGECMTCSVGFRAPARTELAREVLLRLADALDDEARAAVGSAVPAGEHYGDPQQVAVGAPGRLPAELLTFALAGLQAALAEPGALARALGETLSEPKPQVAFAAEEDADPLLGVRLAPGSCMLYDDDHVFLNGEAWRVAGADARHLRELADRRRLDARSVAKASKGLRSQLAVWLDDGWLLSLRQDGHGQPALSPT